MNHFCIIYNHGKKDSKEQANYIRSYLTMRGCKCDIAKGEEHNRRGSSFRYTDPSQINENVECILVIGGDGTLLQAARDLHYNRIPMLGFNYGTLGYLAEVESDGVEDALDCLISNRFTIEKRMLLNGTVIKQDNQIISDYALNDIVLARASGLEVVQFAIYVDGVLLYRYVADGIILATPTGSTAYNLSAGGPIVDPKAKNILLTPVSPHSLNSRSIVLDPFSQVVIEVQRQKGKKYVPTQVCFDGNSSAKLEAGDRIKIEQANLTFDLIKINHVSFLEAVRRKMADR